MSQRAGQGEFGNSLDIIEALKNKNLLTTKSMKARLLKEIGKKGTIGGMYFAKDSIIDVDVPMGGKIVYTNNVSTGRKDYPLTIGTDVELILDDEKQPIEVNKQQKGSLLFYGGLLALGYIVYKIVTTK
jgi:hypothetical protein